MLLHNNCSVLKHVFVIIRLQCRNQDWYAQYAAQGRRNSSSRVTVFPLYAPAKQGFLPTKVDMQSTYENMLLTKQQGSSSSVTRVEDCHLLMFEFALGHLPILPFCMHCRQENLVPAGSSNCIKVT